METLKGRLFIPSQNRLEIDVYIMRCILGDPGADSGGEAKSKRAEKYGMKKSKEL